MNRLLLDNYHMAIHSIRRSRLRSLLTMLGIIIAVVSVITIVSLGEGVKSQVSKQVGKLGSDVITIYPGKLVERDKEGEIIGVNLLSTLGRGTLSENDLSAIIEAENVSEVAPLSLITGTTKAGGSTADSTVIATTDSLPKIINHEVAFGSFLEESSLNGNAATIGRDVARNLFEQNVPIGKTITIRDRQFVVQGVLERFETPNPINPTLDFNNAIFINYDSAKEIAGGRSHIFQIVAQTDDPTSADKSVASINRALAENYNGRDDFTVLQQDETLEIARSVISLVTGLVAGIAAISLLIGGIGIMNIMLVSVSERDREIGVRKAVGASNNQIRTQFLIEAIVLSVWGALLGLIVSALLNLTLRIFTDLTPIITLPVVVVATGVAVIVGAIFGLAPAIKASMKDPIESLRRL